MDNTVGGSQQYTSQSSGFLSLLQSPESIITTGGAFLVAGVIFFETGSVFGIVLPGNSLIFIAGVIYGISDRSFFAVSMLILLVSLAAIGGSIFGYWTGAKLGKTLFTKEDSWLFKKRYIEMGNQYFEKHGDNTLYIARYTPYVRTIVPMIAGAVGMNLFKFFIQSVLSGVIWVTSLVLPAYLLAVIFPGIKLYLGLIGAFLFFGPQVAALWLILKPSFRYIAEKMNLIKPQLDTIKASLHDIGENVSEIGQSAGQIIQTLKQDNGEEPVEKNEKIN